MKHFLRKNPILSFWLFVIVALTATITAATGAKLIKTSPTMILPLGEITLGTIINMIMVFQMMGQCERASSIKKLARIVGFSVIAILPIASAYIFIVSPSPIWRILGFIWFALGASFVGMIGHTSLDDNPPLYEMED